MKNSFSYSTFTTIFNTLNAEDFFTARGEFGLGTFTIAALHLYQPGIKFSSNLTSFVKFWAACYLRENRTITEQQYKNYLAGKNKI